MGIIRKIGGGAAFVWRRIADLSTFAWLWPGGATALAVGLGVLQSLPLAVLFVLALAAFVLTLTIVLMWQAAFGRKHPKTSPPVFPAPPSTAERDADYLEALKGWRPRGPLPKVAGGISGLVDALSGPGKAMQEGLGRGLSGRTSDATGDFRERIAREESSSSALPDMSFEDAVARVRERLGDNDQKIHEAIVDAAYHKRIDVWGRMVAGKPAKLVWRDAWENGTFSLTEGTVVYRPPDNPHAQFRWTGLMFNRVQVDRWMPPDLGPNAWMAG